MQEAPSISSFTSLENKTKLRTGTSNVLNDFGVNKSYTGAGDSEYLGTNSIKLNTLTASVGLTMESEVEQNENLTEYYSEIDSEIMKWLKICS